jgi:hypothetical protein
LHVELETPGNSRPAFWKKHGVDPENVIARLHAEWFALGRFIGEETPQQKQSRRRKWTLTKTVLKPV